MIGKTDNLPENGMEESFDTNTVQWVKGYMDADEDPTEPIVIIYYPILLRSAMQVEISDPAEDDFLGVFVLTAFWRHLIEDILPPGSNGIAVVISNDCGQTFTYKLHGPNATYVGKGDLHEKKYDSEGISYLLSQLGDFGTSERRYSGVDLATEFCPYTIQVFPSDEMLDDFVSPNPKLFSIMAVAIFLFTSVVFLVYDHLTRARQRRILKSALQNSAVVASLFPHSFRDRVLVSQRSTGSQRDTTPQGRLQTFLRNNFSVRTESERGAGPIAEYFEEATVSKCSRNAYRVERIMSCVYRETILTTCHGAVFADIANFTAWSSVREPGQVFSLLENIYGAFDSVAKRRGAYKVETIGDSYVAVAGVPVPRPDHAAVMVRFARDCRQMMSYLTRDLEITLGPGTGDLQMRFGLNSGPGKFLYRSSASRNSSRLHTSSLVIASCPFWGSYRWCIARRKIAISALR